MKRRLAIFALMSVVASASVHAADNDYTPDSECEFSQLLEESLDATAAERLRVEAGAGFLLIQGRRGLSEVLVRGKACASDERVLSGIRLQAERRGNDVVVKAVMPESGWRGRSYARLDLEIEVPTSLALKVDDGSGWIRIRDVGPTELDDGSGEITIEGVQGDLKLHDGSGSITIRGVQGSVVLKDGSGSVEILDVSELVHVKNDGSGSLSITQAGEVRIDSDGSGSISIRDVDGDVEVGDDGSGDIRVEDVRGSLTVDEDGSGSIYYERVGGRVRVPE